MGFLAPTERGDSGVEQKHAVANCSQTVISVLPPGERKQAIPLFVKLLWSVSIVYVVG